MPYRNPTDFELDTCFLKLFDGTEKEIKEISSEINIYQDISNHYMTCSIVIDDASSIISQRLQTYVGGINGLGVVVIRFRTASDSSQKDFPKRTLTFGIYKMTNRARINEKQETYTLHGISEEAYNTKSKKISRSFGRGKGNIITNMIKGVHKEFFGEKPLEADTTKGLHKFTIPNMSVDDTIEFMRLESDSDSRAPLFFFYEDFDGYKFKDLNNLIRSDVIEKYQYIPMNFKSVNESSKFTDSTNIISFALKGDKDYLTKVSKGHFKSKTLNIDILRKNKKELLFDYEKNFANLNTISNKKYPSIDVSDHAYLNMITSRTGHDTDPIFTEEKPVPKKINERKSFRDAYREIVFSQNISLVVAGDSNIQVGKIIELMIPRASITDNDTTDREEDKYISGKFLVARVRHKIQKRVYTTEIDCVRDAGDRL